MLRNVLPALHDPSLMQAHAAHLRLYQPCTILHLCRQTLLICGSASLARSFTHAGRRCSSAAVPAFHDPSLMQADAAHLRQCQPCTILHSCRQTLLIVAPNEKLVVWFAALFELGAWIIDLQTRCALQVICWSTI